MKKKIWIITLLAFGGVCGHAQEADKVKTVNIAGIDPGCQGIHSFDITNLR